VAYENFLTGLIMAYPFPVRQLLLRGMDIAKQMQLF
jgi:hypothetical protein